MSPRNLERILYFALYVVTHIDEHQRERVLQTVQEEAEGKIRRLEQTISDRTGAIEARANGEIMRIRTSTEQKVRQMEEQLAQDSDALTTAASKVKEQLEEAVGKPASKDIIFKQADLTIASKGDNVTICCASGNRGSDAIDNPDRVIVDWPRPAYDAPRRSPTAA